MHTQLGQICFRVFCASSFVLGLASGSYQIPLGCWFRLKFLAAMEAIEDATEEQLEKTIGCGGGSGICCFVCFCYLVEGVLQVLQDFFVLLNVSIDFH